MPSVAKPYCSRCGKHLSPVWKTRCEHCKAKYAEFPPEFRTEFVAPGDEIRLPQPASGGNLFWDGFWEIFSTNLGDLRRRLRRSQADRRGIWLGADLVDGASGNIRIRVDNRRDTAILVTAMGLTRYRDPEAAYAVQRSDAVAPGGFLEVVIDTVSAVTAAPVKERLFNRDLDHAFIEINHDPKRMLELLPPEVRAVLRSRRQRFVHFGKA
jgi:hypothetical protein